MKRRPKKAPSRWRLMWYQQVGKCLILKWHTGTEYECDVLQRACVAAGERHTLCLPGSFKE